MVASSSSPKPDVLKRVLLRLINLPLLLSNGVTKEQLLLQLEKMVKSRFGQEVECSDLSLSAEVNLFMQSAGAQRMILFSIAQRKV